MGVVKFKQFLSEAGQSAGAHELVKLSLEEARSLADKLFQKYQGHNVDDVLPAFDKNFLYAQQLAAAGKTLRKEMPVIEEKDVKDLQYRLLSGTIDVKPPYAPGTNPHNLFPQGMDKAHAEAFLQNGIPLHDHGPSTDDKIACHEQRMPANQLIPIQKQIYYDKSMEPTARNGIAATRKFLTSTYLVMSNDHYIIDGHHRWMGAVLVDPNMALQVLSIDLPLNELLPLTLAYSDAVGNQRNQ